MHQFLHHREDVLAHCPQQGLCACTPDVEVHALSKQQQGVFSVGEVRITLACCQLLVDATQAAVHCLHDTAELPQALLYQILLLLLKPVHTPCNKFWVQILTLNIRLLQKNTPWTV